MKPQPTPEQLAKYEEFQKYFREEQMKNNQAQYERMQEMFKVFKKD